jgi:hypothetical protein
MLGVVNEMHPDLNLKIRFYREEDVDRYGLGWAYRSKSTGRWTVLVNTFSYYHDVPPRIAHEVAHVLAPGYHHNTVWESKYRELWDTFCEAQKLAYGELPEGIGLCLYSPSDIDENVQAGREGDVECRAETEGYSSDALKELVDRLR